jgi:flavorubredoxin
MLTAREIKPGVWWVGGIDWNERLFHGYTTEKGITYNAYVIVDEKITLIDTAKKPFAHELIQRISQVVDPSKIDYVVCNHVEMDHSGSLPDILACAPNAKIFASPAGVNGLKAHYGNDLNITPVKTGDTLNLGKRTLSFVNTPMVHWPDNMVTYSEYDKILFSNDCFGQHFASSAHLDVDNDICEVMKQARKYYANIVLPYGMQAGKALAAVKMLNIDMIAPAHGIIWTKYVPDILAKYSEWVTDKRVEKAVVVFDSMWHSTEQMGRAIAEAFVEKNIEARLIDVKETHESDIMLYCMDAKYVCVGSPTLNMQMMPTVSSFLTYFQGLSPKNANRIGLAFGSYGWAAKGPNDVQKRLQDCGFTLPLDTLTHNWTPDDAYLSSLQSEVVEKLIEAGA